MSTPAVCAASRSTGAVNAPSATVLRSAISTAALSPLPRPKPRLKLREDCEEQVSTRSPRPDRPASVRSEEHTSELQSLMRISYAVFCLKKKKTHNVASTNITYNK